MQTSLQKLWTLPAGDELTPGRGADGLDVIILQLHSVRSQFIQRRCPDVRAVVANVIEPLIICHDENDVRRLRHGWRAFSKSLVGLVLHLVWTHQVPGQVPEAEQAHHGETRQSCRCHGFCDTLYQSKQFVLRIEIIKSSVCRAQDEKDPLSSLNRTTEHYTSVLADSPNGFCLLGKHFTCGPINPAHLPCCLTEITSAPHHHPKTKKCF